MNEAEHKTNYIQIQNLIGQLRMQIKMLSDDEGLAKRAIEKLKELEDLFKERSETSLNTETINEVKDYLCGSYYCPSYIAEKFHIPEDILFDQIDICGSPYDYETDYDCNECRTKALTIMLEKLNMEVS